MCVTFFKLYWWTDILKGKKRQRQQKNKPKEREHEISLVGLQLCAENKNILRKFNHSKNCYISCFVHLIVGLLDVF